MEEKDIRAVAQRASAAQRSMLCFSSRRKTDIIYSASDEIERRIDEIMEVNAREVESARAKGRPEGFVGRLELTPHLIRKAINSCRVIADLTDPVGEEVSVWLRPNGLRISRRRVPVGTVALCLETRPLVNLVAAAVCIKAGNALVSCCDDESSATSSLIVSAFLDGARPAGMPDDAFILIASSEHLKDCRALVSLQGVIDVAILRGGEAFVNDLTEHSFVPVLKHSGGLCHVYVDSDADIDMAVSIVCNSRCFDPYSCSAADVLLVHEAKMTEFIQALLKKVSGQIDFVADERVLPRIPGALPADYDDWRCGYRGMRLVVGSCNSITEAIEHINEYGAHLADVIVSDSEDNQRLFQRRVNSAVVYVNASTAFTDGAEFGMGADVGISTDRFNVRGPVGLEDLTSLKYLVTGKGQIRG